LPPGGDGASGISGGAQQVEVEQAIQASVAATSKGNLGEDLMIERALRASIRELQNFSVSSLSEQEALDCAIQASIVDIREQPHVPTAKDVEFNAVLEKSIQRSLYESGGATLLAGQNSSDPDTEEEEDLQLSIRAPKDLHEENESKDRTEEEIVVEYIKKQSLAEEEYRKSMRDKQKWAPSDDAEEEEDLGHAIEESLKI
jgi:hypothetical protein